MFKKLCCRRFWFLKKPLYDWFQFFLFFSYHFKTCGLSFRPQKLVLENLAPVWISALPGAQVFKRYRRRIFFFILIFLILFPSLWTKMTGLGSVLSYLQIRKDFVKSLLIISFSLKFFYEWNSEESIVRLNS